MRAKLSRLNIIFGIILLCLMPQTLYSAASEHSINLPVEPVEASKNIKKKVKKSVLKKNNPKIPKARIWGIWSLAIGGYMVIFAVLSAMFFLGFYFYLYLLALLLLILIMGIFLAINGVSVIDSTYIHYSENPELKAERLRPLIIREFIYAALLSAIVIGLFFLEFYITAFLCILAIFVLITAATMKYSAIKKLKKDQAPMNEQGH